jgi:hypothetical protein
MHFVTHSSLLQLDILCHDVPALVVGCLDGQPLAGFPILGIAVLAGSITVSLAPAFSMFTALPPGEGCCRTVRPLEPTLLSTVTWSRCGSPVGGGASGPGSGAGVGVDGGVGAGWGVGAVDVLCCTNHAAT